MVYSKSFVVILLCSYYAFALITILTIQRTVHALPGGAPVCTAGASAPGEPHFLPEPGKTIATGPLEDAGFIVTIDGVLLEPGVPLDVQAYEDLQVVMTSSSGIQPFKGALMVVSKEGLDTRGAFIETGLSGLQLNFICEFDFTRSGVTHLNNDIKTSVSATMRFTENIADLLFDANIVVVNNAQESFYYYTGYTINVVGATSPPTRAPRRRKCGLFGLGLFCPFTACGLFGRWLYGDDFC
jgi:hypothetical protein